jgi:membrane protease YdiL (CAAX protease family)
VDWGRTQPDVEGFEVHRDGHVIRLGYGNRGWWAVRPPWKDLGYAGLQKAQLSFPLLPSLNAARSIVVLVWAAQVGFRFFGLRRIGTASRRGELSPMPLSGPIRPALILGRVTGIGLFFFGWVYGLALDAIFGISSAGIWATMRQYSPWGQAAIVAAGAIAAPVCEEVFFRGAYYGSFAGAGFERLGIGVSAVCFSMSHLDSANSLAYVAFGLLFVWVYRRTNSILAPILAHAINNAMAFAFLIFGVG